MLIIIFGLAGAGKNYVSNILADHFGFAYFDGDHLLPEDMLTVIKSKMPFTQEMRDTLTTLIIKKIAEQEKQHKNIVLAQGLYKNLNRQQIAKVYPHAEFLWVDANPEIRLARLKERNNSIDADYAQGLNIHFEEPVHLYKVVVNNTDEADIIQQVIKQFPTLDR